MNQNLLFLSFAAFCFLSIETSAQSFEISRRILATDTVTEEGLTFAVSSDDAEQENNTIDALFDDDLDAGWEGDDGDANVLTTGLRFRDLGIPQGATIDSAFILFHAHEGKSADDVANLTIVCDATDNADTFNETDLITDRPRTTAEVRWVVAEEWDLWMPYRTPDLKALVQEIVDRPGWEPGNSIAFIMLGEDQGPSEFENAREFTSFENIADPEDGGDGTNKPERIPLLLVYYSLSETVVDLRVIATDTITEEGVTFAVSSDDAEQENNTIDALFDDDLDAGWEGDDGDANVLTTGIRFQNIQIPQGAVIDSAFLELTTHEAKSADDVANLTIACEATDDSETFNEDDLITDRPRTDAQLRWVVAEDWDLWTPYRTPDLKDLVQEVVSRPGWVPGNSIAFFLLGEDQGPSEFENAREFTSFENIADPEDGGDGTNKPERIPRLLIYFSPGNVTSIREVFSPQVEPLTVYPNPARDLINIELESDGVAVIEIFNLEGRLVKGLRSSFGRQQQMNVQDLPNGMYMVRARQADKVYVQQIVIR